MAKFRWICLTLAFISFPHAALAENFCNRGELDIGVKAADRGDIVEAMNSFMPSATRGCAEAMHNMGFIIAWMSATKPKTDDRDLRIDAYMWFTLAAQHHPPGPLRQNSLENRKSFVAMHLMTPGQIAEGERLAMAWRAGQNLPKQKSVTSGGSPSSAKVVRRPQWAKDFAAALPKRLRNAFQEGDNPTILSLARPLAKKGHPQAQTLMGMLNYFGNGLPQSYSEAAHWYLLAAKQDEPVAQSNLGDMYYGGQGVERNYRKAFDLWTKAAGKRHTIAMVNLGLFHAEGNGVGKNICEAYSWWRRAASLGGGIGQSNISTMLDLGDGIPQDYLRAFVWASLAVEYMEPGQDTQLDRAASQRELLSRKISSAQLQEADRLLRKQSLKQLESSLPDCVH